MLHCESFIVYNLQVFLITISHTCRIAAMDDDGNFKEFNVDGTTASLTLISQMSNFDLGIHRIIAVPVDLWSVEYITPALFCVKENKV